MSISDKPPGFPPGGMTPPLTPEPSPTPGTKSAPSTPKTTGPSQPSTIPGTKYKVSTQTPSTSQVAGRTPLPTKPVPPSPTGTASTPTKAPNLAAAQRQQALVGKTTDSKVAKGGTESLAVVAVRNKANEITASRKEEFKSMAEANLFADDKFRDNYYAAVNDSLAVADGKYANDPAKEEEVLKRLQGFQSQISAEAEKICFDDAYKDSLVSMLKTFEREFAMTGAPGNATFDTKKEEVFEKLVKREVANAAKEAGKTDEMGYLLYQNPDKALKKESYDKSFNAFVDKMKVVEQRIRADHDLKYWPKEDLEALVNTLSKEIPAAVEKWNKTMSQDYYK